MLPHIGFTILLAGTVSLLHAQIILDGDFQDWAGSVPVAEEAPGDASSGFDLHSLTAKSNDQALFLWLRMDPQTLATEPLTSTSGIGNDIRIVIDIDQNTATGSQDPLSLGAETELRLGERQLISYSSAGFSSTLRFAEFGVLGAPNYSNPWFEFRIPYTLPTAGGVSWEATQQVGVAVIDAAGGDRLPNSGYALVPLQRDITEPLEPTPLARAPEASFRLLTHNVLNNGPLFRPDQFRRILGATQPDIICWQEAYLQSIPDYLSLVEEVLPLPQGEQWHWAKVSDCLTISRWPIAESTAVDFNLLTLIDTPDSVSLDDLVLFNVHTPCCRSESGRDMEHDRIAAAWRDLMAGAGPFAVAPDVPVIMTGDFNMIGFRRQFLALRDGNIIHNNLHGPDFAPGREEGSLRTVLYRQTHQPIAFTWHGITSDFFPGRLDWTFYSGDSLTLLRDYSLYTPSMPPDVLTAAGLAPGDSLSAADHLPLVADFRMRPAAVAEPGAEGFSLY